MKHAFTLIEVLASLLVLSLGTAAAIGLSTLALRRAEAGRAQALALPTAMSVLQDSTPLLPGETASDWTTNAETTTGYLNGFWVRRIETIIERLPGLNAVDVLVEVSLPNQPEPLARLRTRMLRAGP